MPPFDDATRSPTTADQPSVDLTSMDRRPRHHPVVVAEGQKFLAVSFSMPTRGTGGCRPPNKPEFPSADAPGHSSPCIRPPAGCIAGGDERHPGNRLPAPFAGAAVLKRPWRDRSDRRHCHRAACLLRGPRVRARCAGVLLSPCNVAIASDAAIELVELRPKLYRLRSLVSKAPPAPVSLQFAEFTCGYDACELSPYLGTGRSCARAFQLLIRRRLHSGMLRPASTAGAASILITLYPIIARWPTVDAAS